MKKILFLLLLSCAALCWADTDAPEGSGTFEDPYRLASTKDLLWIVNNELSSGSYSILTADIDLHSVENWEPRGTEATPFTGNIDGSGYSIKGLYVNDPEKGQAGLFAYASDCNIENLVIEGDVICKEDGGLLFGVCEKCTVKNVTLSGSVSGSGSYTGLLAGYAKKLTCSKVSAFGAVVGNYNNGGLIGFCGDSNIQNCFTVTEITGLDGVGGIAGFAEYSTINGTYASDSTTGEAHVGGILGNGQQTTVTASFYDSTKSRANEFGTGVTTEAMLKKATYVGFDFLNVWTIDEGNSTPTFITPADSLFWSKFTATSTCKITLKGTLTGADLDGIKLFQNIGLCTLEKGVFLTSPILVETFPLKTKEEKVTFKDKKNQLRYIAKNQKITVAYDGGSGVKACDLQVGKYTLDFTGVLAQGITKDSLVFLPLSLCDEAMTSGVLSGTAVQLTEKGNKLSYKSKTITYKVNLKNGKFNAKATLTDTVQGAYGKVPTQQ